ncbi:MAG: sigma-70 family RNA polymerase sigma factor [Planctomycetota bacterium]
MTSFDPESTLQQDDWLRRIARQLVRDPERADDLAQEAWLAGLERGRADDRPWLFGVLRNATRASNRKEARLRDRALRAPRPTDAPATDEVVEDLQLRARLAEELARVEEPYRTALYLRFVVGVSPREGARRTGVARSTFGDRVTRGLALLRKRMDDAHDGDRRAWAAPLLPLAGTGGPIATVAAWTLMTMTTKTAAAVGLSAALLLLVARAADGPQTARTTAAPEDATEDVAALPEPLAAVEGPTASRSSVSGTPTPKSARVPDTAGDAGARLVARVVLGDGSPAAGTRWTLEGQLRSNEDRGLAPETSTLRGMIDDDGALEIAFEPERTHRYRLKLDSPESAPESWSWQAIEPREVVDLGTVQLLRAGRIVGRLAHADGEAIEGEEWSIRARIRTPAVDGRSQFGYRGVVGEDGAFTVERVPPGPTSLEVSSSGSSVVEPVTVDVVSGTTHEVEVRIERPAAGRRRVTVTLDDSAGLPKPDVDASRITLVDPQGTRRTSRERFGPWSAVFDDVGEGPFTVEVDDPRFLPWSREGVAGGETVHAAVRGSASIELQLTGHHPDAVDLPTVEIETLDRQGSTLRHAIVDGSYTLDHAVPGDYRLTVTSASGSTTLDVLGVQPAERRVVAITLGGDVEVTGRAVHADGVPVVGRSVRLVRPARTQDSLDSAIAMNRPPFTNIDHVRIEIDVARTAEDGSFALVAQDPGRYLVVLGEHDELRTESPPLDIAPDESLAPVVLVAPSAAKLRGTLEAPADLDLKGWVLLAYDPRAERRTTRAGERCRLRADRTFLFGDLEPGPREIYLASPSNAYLIAEDGRPLHGRLLAEVTLEVDQDESLDLEFAGPEPSVVTFEIDGPLPDSAPVKIMLGDGEDLGRSCYATGLFPRVGPVTVDAATYVDVRVSGEDWAYVSKEPVLLAPGARATVSLQLPLIAGTVRIDGPDGPLRETFVEVALEGGGGTIGRATDDEGRVELLLAPGRHVVSVGSEGRDGPKGRTPLEWRAGALPDVVTLTAD